MVTTAKFRTAVSTEQTHAPDVAESTAQLCQSVSLSKATGTPYQNSTTNWLPDV